MEIINSQMLTTVELERCVTWGGCNGNGGGDSCPGFTTICGALSGCGINICMECFVDCICPINR